MVDLSLVPRDAIPGAGPGLLATPAGPVGVAVSFEVFFPSRVRAAVAAGGQLVAVPTNAASFPTDEVPAQELAAARLRAIETGRYLVQAAPTGYSAIVAPDGTMQSRTQLGTAQLLTGDVDRRDGATPCVQAGDVPVVLVACSCWALGGGLRSVGYGCPYLIARADDDRRGADLMDLSLIAFAYVAGNAATVNPCGFAMLPAFASFVIGDVDADRAPASLGLRLWRAVRLGATVSLAFIAVFAATGLVFTYVSRQVVAVMPWLAVAVGAVLLVYGLAVVSGRGKLTFRLPNPAEGRGNNRSGLLFGVGYAVASLSCTLPVFLTVVAGSLTTGGLASGVGGFIAYGAGMGTIVFAVAISMALARDGLVGWLRHFSRHLERVGGGVLALAGAYLLLYWGYALGPGSRPTLDSSAPAPVSVVSRLSSLAAQYLDTPLGHSIVVLLALGVLASIVIGLVARRRAPESAPSDQECPSCPPHPAPQPVDSASRSGEH